MTLLLSTSNGGRRREAAKSMPRHTRGAALAMALVMLLVLTIIGVTTMNVSSLEARMAGNMQETNRAFQLAESALQEAFERPSLATSLRVGQSTTTDFPSTSTTITFKEISSTAGRASAPVISGTRFRKAHFMIQADTQTARGGKASLVQGFAMDIPPE